MNSKHTPQYPSAMGLFVFILALTLTQVTFACVGSDSDKTSSAKSSQPSPQQEAKPLKTIPYFSAEYDAEVQGIGVKATRKYSKLDNGLMKLDFNAKSFMASINESTVFRWDGDRIRPREFSHSRSIFGIKRDDHIQFDWQAKQISSTRKGKTKNLEYSDSALDRLSFQLQLQQDLLQDISTNAYQIVDKGRIKENRFELIGEETLETKLGAISTLKIKVKRDSKKRITYFWVAPQWHNLLVKLEQYKIKPNNQNEKDFALELTGGFIGDQVIEPASSNVNNINDPSLNNN